jgi:hypothetical protein
MKSSGKQTQFITGSKRDDATGKPRMELLPFDLLERVAHWYTLGAEKYGDNNWRLGQPKSHVLGSLIRHLSKYIKGDTDEDHLSAVIWNALSLMNVDEYHKDDSKINDTEWFTNGKPNGRGRHE